MDSKWIGHNIKEVKMYLQNAYIVVMFMVFMLCALQIRVFSYLSQPGRVFSYLSQPGRVFSYLSQPGRVFSYLSQPGRVFSYLSQPGRIFSYLSQPGRRNVLCDSCRYLLCDVTNGSNAWNYIFRRFVKYMIAWLSRRITKVLIRMHQSDSCSN